MAMKKGRKRGLKQMEDAALEYSRKLYWGVKLPKWDWTRRGSWHSKPPKRHPGWAAYHANKEK
jgi:hypothetical protein